MLEKRKPYRNKKILQAAKGVPCLALFPGCTGGGEDTCARHFNRSWAGKGMGQKADDCAVFFSCEACEQLYDGRRYLETPEERNEWAMSSDGYVLVAYYRTIRYLLDLGVIK